MKNGIIIAFIAVLGIIQTQAQVSFKPGLRGGLNLTHFTKGDQSSFYNDNTIPNSNNRIYNSKTDFYLSFYGALKLTKYYTLQPELGYSRQGAIFKFANDSKTAQYDVSYLSLAVVNKFTFTDKFNVHIGPTIDFEVENNFDTDASVDLAFLLGAGFNFTNNFGIEARVKKGIIPVLDFSDGNHTNVVFQFGVNYTFDVK
jgi:Outer membrane protein beta-barrel domain